MTTFKDQMALDLAAVHFNTGEFAQVVTYTPAGGGPSIQIPAVVDYDNDPEKGPAASRARAEIQINKADLAAWSYRDQVAIDGAAWTVDRLAWADDGIWCLQIHRDARLTLGA